MQSMGREMKRQMKLFKEFCRDTIFTYEWSEFCDRTYIVECLPDNNMVTVAVDDTQRNKETHHDTL